MSIDLTRFPYPRQLDHLWADYIELMCLADVDDEVSQSEVLDRIEEADDLGAFKTLDVGPDRAETDDLRNLQINNWFRHLEYREGAFDQFYPFSVEESGHTLKRCQAIEGQHRLYLFFLLCSNLRTLDRASQNCLASQFEIVSKAVVESVLPAHAHVHLFDHRNGSDHYSGPLFERIKLLANDLNEKVVAKREDFNPDDYGDGGLDIVAWIPLGDEPGLPILLGQCACTLEWVDKQTSSSADRWSRRVSMVADPSNMAFIPHCFRRAFGTWYKASDITNTILFDRVRLLRNLNLTGISIDDLLGSAYDIVEEAINYEEEVF